jgi:hypothetical protein
LVCPCATRREIWGFLRREIAQRVLRRLSRRRRDRRHLRGGASRRLDRVVQAGGSPISWVALAVELQRDWAREDTVADAIEIVLTERLLKE